MTGAKRKSTPFERSEENYREIKALNQSMISKFDSDPAQFYREFILGEKDEDDGTSSTGIGDLADFYLLECNGDENDFNQRFSDHFGLFAGVKGTAQAFTLADKLYKVSRRDTNESGLITSGFEDRFKEAFEFCQQKALYKKKTWEYALEDFNKTGKEYFDAKIQNTGKTIVDQRQVEKAIKICNQLRNDDNHGDFINQSTTGDLEVLKKVAIEFEFMGWDCKAEIDFMHIDHRAQRILRRDLKTNYDNEGFEYSYIKWYYYIQNAFYHEAAVAFAEQHNLEDYAVSPMDFLVLDTSANNRRPLLYETTMDHVLQGLNGFTFNGSFYRGVKELVEEITWANDNGIWNISKKNFESNGIVKLKSY